METWARLVSLSGKYDSFDLINDRLVIGRGAKCDIRLANELGISSKHCVIFREVEPKTGDYVIFVEDTSTNGTFVDKKPLKKKKIVLQDGVELSFYISETDKITFLFQDLLLKKNPIANKTRYERGNPERKYLVKKELGSGAFATVKLVIDNKSGEPYAMKILDKKRVAMASHSTRDTLQDEIELLAQIDHPHIVRMEEVFETDKELFVILELVTGGELFDKIVEKGRLAERETRPLFRQMLSAVQYLHKRGIAHRDLKPENILLCRRRASSALSMSALSRAKTLLPGQVDQNVDDDKDSDEWQVKLADFGLSRMVSDGSFMQTLAGTPQYVAPEVLFAVNSGNGSDSEDEKPKGYGKECDIWSLGVILYVMLSGTAPFDDDNQPKLFENIRSGIYSFDDRCWTTISDEAKQLIRRMLCVDVNKRITLTQIEEHDWLKHGLGKHPKKSGRTSSKRSAETTSGPRKRRK